MSSLTLNSYWLITAKKGYSCCAAVWFFCWAPLVTLDARLQRQVTRRHLLALSDVQLKDIGISRVDAEREGNKRFWQD